MKFLTPIVLSTITIAAFACSVETEEPTRTYLGELRLDDPTAPAPESFVNARGVKFVLFDRDSYTFRPRPVGFEEMTEEELAEGFRAVTTYRGKEYIQEEPAWQIAKNIKAGITPEGGPEYVGTAPTGPNDEDEDVPVEGEFQQKSQNVIYGSDDRTTEDSVYPYRTHIAISGSSNFNNTGYDCSATLIGPSTAVSLASCFHGGEDEDFYADKSWAPGADKDSGTTFPHGAWTGCYFVYVPAGWVTGPYQTWIQWDFAGLEFDDPLACSLTPGNTVGHLGYRAATDAEIESNDYNVKVSGFPESYTDWPSLFYGAHDDIYVGAPGAPYSYALHHFADQTNGQEGVGIYMRYTPSGGSYTRYVIGVQNFGAVQGANTARRMDSTFINFLTANTNL